MKKRTLWTAVCIVSIGAFAFVPMRSFAVNGSWTSLLPATKVYISAPLQGTTAAWQTAETAEQNGKASSTDQAMTQMPVTAADKTDVPSGREASAEQDQEQSPSTAADKTGEPSGQEASAEQAQGQSPSADADKTGEQSLSSERSEGVDSDSGAHAQAHSPAVSASGDARALAADIQSADQLKNPQKGASILAPTVEEWKRKLSKEHGYESWSKASWSSYPLGPGTHGWVVLISDGSHEVGYMIVHTTDNGSLRLTEYGTGSSPLFSFNTLYRTLIQQELIPDTISYEQFMNGPIIRKERIYANPLEAVWKTEIDGETYYIDAKTGELLPINEEPQSNEKSSQKATAFSGAADKRLLPSFDPYERMSWVLGTPLSVNSLDDIKAALQEHEQLTYVAELYGGKANVPLAVIGYRQQGGDAPYLVVDQDGERSVLLQDAIEQGHLYP